MFELDDIIEFGGKVIEVASETAGDIAEKAIEVAKEEAPHDLPAEIVDSIQKVIHQL